MIAIGDVALVDVSLILAVYAVVVLCHSIGRRLILRRLSIILSLAVALWSVANAAYTFSVGAQLRLEVLTTLIYDARYCWPIVWSRARSALWLTLAGGIVATGVMVWMAWRVFRPPPLPRDRRRELPRIAMALGMLVVAIGVQRLCQRHSDLGYLGEGLRQSPHVEVIRSILASGSGDEMGAARQIARANERSVGLPATSGADLPNIVIVLMESVAYWTSLEDPDRSVTPVLRELAELGVEFTTTRAGITVTNKSIFAALTGVSPMVYPKKVEGVLVDRPYESLATVLRRCGYRSGFFQMARAESFYAGMLANLGFDQFWSRANLEDPSKHLSYAAGDDFAVLEPAFTWATQESEPYLLVLMTSIAHDPYVVPARFGGPRETTLDKFLHCVEVTDAFLGEVRRRIKTSNSPRDTLLCAIADHGEAFPFQHGLWGHLEVPFEEALRIPWVIWWPEKLKPRQIETPCHILDVTPTILALLGFDIRQADFDGEDALRPLGGAADRRHFFSGFGRGAFRGYVEGTTKYVYTPQTGTVLQYNLVDDPEEKSPIQVAPPEADGVIEALTQWERQQRLDFPAGRDVKPRLLFDHWRAWSSGQRSWSYYVP